MIQAMEPHGQSPWYARDVHKGRTSRTRGPIHRRVEPVVLLVRDRIPIRTEMGRRIQHLEEEISNSPMVTILRNPRNFAS